MGTQLGKPNLGNDDDTKNRDDDDTKKPNLGNPTWETQLGKPDLGNDDTKKRDDATTKTQRLRRKTNATQKKNDDTKNATTQNPIWETQLGI